MPVPIGREIQVEIETVEVSRLAEASTDDVLGDGKRARGCAHDGRCGRVKTAEDDSEDHNGYRD
jgi:hypothetical protein